MRFVRFLMVSAPLLAAAGCMDTADTPDEGAPGGAGDGVGSGTGGAGGDEAEEAFSPSLGGSGSGGAGGDAGIDPKPFGVHNNEGISWGLGGFGDNLLGDPWETCPGVSTAVALLATEVVSGSLVGAVDDYQGCGDEGAGTGDAVYAFVLAAAGTVTVSVAAEAGQGFDPAFSLQQTCGTGGTCVNAATNETESWTGHLDAGIWYVTVDSANGVEFAFDVSVELAAPACGDGVVNASEQCDPGAGAPNDGCYNPGHASECTLQPTVDYCPGSPTAITVDGSTVSISDTTVGAESDARGHCADFESLAGDLIYRFDPSGPGTLQIDVVPAEGSSLDPAVYIRTDCATQNLCFDHGLGESIQFDSDGSSIYVVVDGAAETSGAFELTATLTTSACGDGVLSEGEDCDPGVGQAGDGCYDPGSANECLFEPSQSEKDTCSGELFNISTGVTLLSFANGHSTAGYTDDYESLTCNYASGGKERVYEIVPDTSGTLTATVGENGSGTAYCAIDIWDPMCLDFAIYARTTCDQQETEIACQDQSWDTAETISFAVTEGTSYFIFVDGYDGEWWSTGAYNLELELTP